MIKEYRVYYNGMPATKEQLDEIAKYAKELVVLPRQAEDTSTTQMIQVAVKKHLDKVYELLDGRS